MSSIHFGYTPLMWHGSQWRDRLEGMDRQPCVVYRGAREADTYLYVARPDDLARVPAALLARLGELEAVLELDLHPQRRLARADVHEVLRALRDDGFYLQLPPREGLAIPVRYGR